MCVPAGDETECLSSPVWPSSPTLNPPHQGPPGTRPAQVSRHKSLRQSPSMQQSPQRTPSPAPSAQAPPDTGHASDDAAAPEGSGLPTNAVEEAAPTRGAADPPATAAGATAAARSPSRAALQALRNSAASRPAMASRGRAVAGLREKRSLPGAPEEPAATGEPAFAAVLGPRNRRRSGRGPLPLKAGRVRTRRSSSKSAPTSVSPELGEQGARGDMQGDAAPQRTARGSTPADAAAQPPPRGRTPPTEYAGAHPLLHGSTPSAEGGAVAAGARGEQVCIWSLLRHRSVFCRGVGACVVACAGQSALDAGALSMQESAPARGPRPAEAPAAPCATTAVHFSFTPAQRTSPTARARAPANRPEPETAEIRVDTEQTATRDGPRAPTVTPQPPGPAPRHITAGAACGAGISPVCTAGPSTAPSEATRPDTYTTITTGSHRDGPARLPPAAAAAQAASLTLGLATDAANPQAPPSSAPVRHAGGATVAAENPFALGSPCLPHADVDPADGARPGELHAPSGPPSHGPTPPVMTQLLALNPHSVPPTQLPPPRSTAAAPASVCGTLRALGSFVSLLAMVSQTATPGSAHRQPATATPPPAAVVQSHSPYMLPSAAAPDLPFRSAVASHFRSCLRALHESYLVPAQPLLSTATFVTPNRPGGGGSSHAAACRTTPACERRSSQLEPVSPPAATWTIAMHAVLLINPLLCLLEDPAHCTATAVDKAIEAIAAACSGANAGGPPLSAPSVHDPADPPMHAAVAHSSRVTPLLRAGSMPPGARRSACGAGALCAVLGAIGAAARLTEASALLKGWLRDMVAAATGSQYAQHAASPGVPGMRAELGGSAACSHVRPSPRCATGARRMRVCVPLVGVTRSTGPLLCA